MIPEQNDDGFLIDNNILLNCQLFFFLLFIAIPHSNITKCFAETAEKNWINKKMDSDIVAKPRMIKMTPQCILYLHLL